MIYTKLALESIKDLYCKFKGTIGSRLAVNEHQWLLSVPYSNPGMMERFRMREYGYNDEMVVWYGEFAGKHLTASVLAWQINKSKALKNMIIALIDELAQVQDESGYIGPYGYTNRFIGNEKRRLWDVWGHYHIMFGLLMWHEVSGERKPLEICLKAADAICSFFLESNVSILEADYSEMNTAIIHVLGLLYRKTGNDKYLQMIRHIENAWDDERGGGYVTAALANLEFYQMRKPRWESLHPIQGIMQLYQITGETKYRIAFERLWHSINKYDCHNTGGFSSGEQACGNPFDLSAIETCCTVAWSVLSVDMLRLTGDSFVADQLELSLYNGIIGSQSPSGRWWTYNTPMDGIKEASAHSIVFQAQAGSPELNCCSVNGPRALALLRDWAFMGCGEAIVVNYYGPGTYNINEDVKMRIQTKYPCQNKVSIIFDAPSSKKMNLRIPAWSLNTCIRINGVLAENVQPGKYYYIDRSWNSGDVIEIHFDFSPRFLHGERQCENKVSIYRGPLLLAYDEIHNGSPISTTPTITPEKVVFHKPVSAANSRYARPIMMLSVDTGRGATVMLCDFASAGIAGSRYVTWLSC